jgi:fructose-1,6-bisphosphatase/inositol monophosphatase family enzyme
LNKVFYGIKDIGSFLKNLRTEKIIKLEYNENCIENNKNKNEKKDLIGCSTIFAKKLKKKISSRIIGSIGISIAYCSDSTFDGFFCPSCKIWDFAGGIGILNSMNFPIFLKEINQEKKIFQVAVHRDQEELQKFIELFNEE